MTSTEEILGASRPRGLGRLASAADKRNSAATKAATLATADSAAIAQAAGG